MDKTALQIRSKNVSTSVLAFKGCGIFGPEDSDEVVQQQTEKDAMDIMIFLQHNCNGILLNALAKKMITQEAIQVLADTSPGLFRTAIMQETGRLVLVSRQTNTTILEGIEVINPVTLGNTTSNKNL